MVFEGLPTDDLVLRALPESLTFLVLKDLDIESISSVKTFLEKRGEGLHTLSISLDDYQEMETSYLLEVIADKCVNLEYLRLHDAKDSPFSADELYQLIDKLGSKLIESRLTCHEVDFSLVEKIIPACNRLKYLHLILGGEGAVGKDTTWDKLKYMTKLVWAKIQTGTTQDSAITVNYKNQKWIYSSTPLDSSFFNVSDEDDELDYW
ncbi:hypothetical protein HDE_12219 [Halotydeus destructor]|nr:hypothetical protein HDE_12219 [Halotydeus destructor]